MRAPSAARRAALAPLIALALLAAPLVLTAQEPPAPPAEKSSGGDPLDELIGGEQSDPQAVAIIDRYIEAIGGAESLAAIQDRVERFDNKKLTPTGETVMKMHRFLARPVMIREDWELPGMGITKDNEPLTFVQVYDGEKAWVKTMGFVSPLTGKTLTVFVWDKHIDDFFASWREDGWSAKYVGPAEMNGRAVDVVELTSFAGNQNIRYSFAKDDGLLVGKTWMEGQPPAVVRKEVTYDEYLKIRFRDNPERWIRHANTHRIFENGELALEKVYTEIVLNGGLPKSTFARPEGQDYDADEIQRRKEEAAAAEGGAAEGGQPEEPAKPVWEKPKKPNPAPAPTPPKPEGGAKPDGGN